MKNQRCFYCVSDLCIEIIVYTVENFIEANTVIACVCVRALREFDFNAQQHAFQTTERVGGELALCDECKQDAKIGRVKYEQLW